MHNAESRQRFTIILFLGARIHSSNFLNLLEGKISLQLFNFLNIHFFIPYNKEKNYCFTVLFGSDKKLLRINL